MITPTTATGIDGIEVPAVDITPFFSGTPEERDEVVAQVADTCEQIGFLTLTGHGVDPDLVNRFRAVSQEFYDLPEEEKLKVRRAAVGHPGYHPFAAHAVAQTLGEHALPDLKESFSIAPVASAEDPYYSAPAAGTWFAGNRWPERPEEFQEVWLEYFRAMERLAEVLAQIFSRALGLGEDYFAPSFAKHTSRLAAVHYPPQNKPHDPGQLRNGPHTDYGAFTILSKPDGAGGLQVVNKAGEWVDVVPPRGAFIINVGDLMARWVNDRWVSTMHRVTNPPPEETSEGSVSIVYFCQPSYDAHIVAPESCVDDEHPAKYPPTTTGEYLTGKYQQQEAAAAM